MTIALAGGAGHLGQYIVDAFIDAGRKDDILVLSRSAKDEFKAKVQAVDYDNIGELSRLFKEQNIDTIISTLITWKPEDTVRTHSNLINAAIKSGTVKRFIPGEWTSDYEKGRSAIPWSIDSFKPTREKLKQSGLEFTAVEPGALMDYLLAGGAKYHDPWPLPVKIQEAKAVIPGTGDETFHMTMSEDLAKVVVALVNAPPGSWEPVTEVAGDETSWNKILQYAEEAVGKKFEVKYMPEDEMREQIAAAQKANDWMSALVDGLNLWLSVNRGAYQEHPTKFMKGIEFQKVRDIVMPNKKD